MIRPWLKKARPGRGFYRREKENRDEFSQRKVEWRMERVERRKRGLRVHTTVAERAILLGLDQILRSEKVRRTIRPVVERVRTRLSQETSPSMAWEPIPLTIYGGTLPDAIKSSWVFVLRAG